MDVPTRRDLVDLIHRAPGDCVSIFLPTHREKEEAQQDPIRLKNLLHHAEVGLLARGHRATAVRDLLEPADITGDRASLARLADSSGGQMMSLETISNLPDRLGEIQNRQASPATLRLWDSAYLFLFVVACLVAEWSLRKRVGLA